MQDDTPILIVLGVLALAVVVGFFVAVHTATTPDQAAIRAALAAGTITYSMSENQVLQVWGEPETLETKLSESPMGPRDTLQSFWEGLSGTPLERALSRHQLFSYSIWTYHKPWRTVTFDSAGLVVDWFPRG
ncbi:MAG: hypothetical protein NT125_08300 [Candidatus Bipolaricaulota bacterium]|nr:hypothetical protein [Candidatus Bipolaricaulota bacterium]